MQAAGHTAAAASGGGSSTTTSSHGHALHAHWDCGAGVSVTAMTAAVLGAVRDPMKMQAWMEELQTVLPLVFPGALCRCRIRFSLAEQHKYPAVQYDILSSADVAVHDDADRNNNKNSSEHGSGGATASTAGASTAVGGGKEWNWTLLLYLLQEPAASELLPETVIQLAAAAFTKLLSAEKRIGCAPYTTRQCVTAAVEIVSVLWCMDKLNIRTATCSPLPWTPNVNWSSGGNDNDNDNSAKTTQSSSSFHGSKCTVRTPQMLLGMPIASAAVSSSAGTAEDDDNTSEQPLMTDAAVAVLTVLTQQPQYDRKPGVGRSVTSFAAGKLPPMTLRAMTAGYDQVPFQRGKVSLLLGDLITDSDDEDDGGVAAAYIDDSGCHAGTTRSLLQTSQPDLWHVERLQVLECNLDDITAEHLAFCADVLLANGAADVWTVPAVMKKGRAAHALHCLCSAAKTKGMLAILFQHSTTLGVRVQSVHRVSLNRVTVRVDLSAPAAATSEDGRDENVWISTGGVPVSASAAAALQRCKKQQQHGSSAGGAFVNVKLGLLGRQVVTAKAEFDHCKAVSLKTGLPLQAVADEAVARAKRQHHVAAATANSPDGGSSVATPTAAAAAAGAPSQQQQQQACAEHQHPQRQQQQQQQQQQHRRRSSASSGEANSAGGAAALSDKSP